MADTREPETLDLVRVVRADHGCFGCGDDNPIGLHLRFAGDGDCVRASFTPSCDHQGFGNIVHGGIISTVLDEAMAWATARAGFWAMTGDMRVRFRRPLTIGEPTVVTARVSGARGRFISTASELMVESDGSPIATATATFVTVDADIEAAWRAQYLRESDKLMAELPDDANPAIPVRPARDEVSLSGGEPVASENHR